MTTQAWTAAAILGVLLALLAVLVGGPTWAVVLGLVGGFLIVLLFVGLRE